MYVKNGGVWKPLIQPLSQDLVFWMPTSVYTEGEAGVDRVSSPSIAHDNVSGSSVTLSKFYEDDGTNTFIISKNMPSTFLNYSFSSKITFSIWHKVTDNNYSTGISKAFMWGLLSYGLANAANTHYCPLQSNFATEGDSSVVSYWHYGTNLNVVEDPYYAPWLSFYYNYHLLTVTCDFDTGTFKVYRDKTLIHTGTSTGYGVGAFGKFESTSNYGFMFFRSNGYNNGYQRNWYVKHFKIWDKLLSSSDVTDLYNLGQNPTI